MAFNQYQPGDRVRDQIHGRTGTVTQVLADSEMRQSGELVIVELDEGSPGRDPGHPHGFDAAELRRV